MAHHPAFAVEVTALALSAIPTLAVAGLIVGSIAEEARRKAPSGGPETAKPGPGFSSLSNRKKRIEPA
jgi:hypothetical protein